VVRVIPEPSSRRIAYDALRRIESQGAYANLVMRSALAASELSDSDRRFATDLVYGTTRMRRACDTLLDRFIAVPPDEGTRTLLRLGAYQLVYARIPPHAAVSETVALAPQRTRGFVNAVLRKLSAAGPMRWPSEAARLSYPDWVAARLIAELGAADATASMVRMNEPPPVTQRDDGYVQDLSSQWVASAVGATPGERVLDVCAAPGGKSTALAATGAHVVAIDIRLTRLGLVVDNLARLRHTASTVAADGAAPPFRSGSFDAVLIDAPCSGLGALRRRADARWRVEPADVDALAALQRRLLVAGAALVAPGGRLVYSVCTLTAQESVAHEIPAGFDVDEATPHGTWQPYRHGWRVLPHEADTDGMVMIRYVRRV
jgi:16S rRNA (cytosine967-C5)-methyltransferase